MTVPNAELRERYMAVVGRFHDRQPRVWSAKWVEANRVAVAKLSGDTLRKWVSRAESLT